MDLAAAKRLAHEKMTEHGLTDKGWTFKWSTAQTTFGWCHHIDMTIALSKPLTKLNDEAAVLDVILHEIAHALLPRKHGHDKVWKAMARAIGANPERCFDGDDTNTVPARYTGSCRHGCTIERYRLSKRLKYNGATCRKHSSIVVWTDHETGRQF